ncbi:MAG: STAS domain-containing protein [Streptosporangiales bacterium]|jgi:anti-sigma B factor antagonist|nr:STAS domain-containing protein [Streptosporangiales bacterium]
MTDFARAMPPTQATQLELAFSAAAGGNAVVRARGELDIATADQAFAYLRDVLDSDALNGGAPDGDAPGGRGGSLTINLEGLTFCDAAGLGALARLAGHARRADRELTLTAARPSLLRIMRITGMDRTFPELRTAGIGVIAWPRQAAAVD